METLHLIKSRIGEVGDKAAKWVFWESSRVMIKGLEWLYKIKNFYEFSDHGHVRIF